jgi:2'-5' RNA ligase
MHGNSRGENSRGDSRVDYVESVADVLRRIAVEDRSKLILDRSVKSFANSVGLRILDSDRFWLDSIAYESSLKRQSSKLASLIEDDLSRSRIPSEPAVFKPHCDLFARTVVDSYNFAKANANADDGQCFDDKFPASNIDLPWAN